MLHAYIIHGLTKSIQYSINSYTTINTPYNWLAFLVASCFNSGYMSSYVLVRICN